MTYKPNFFLLSLFPSHAPAPAVVLEIFFSRLGGRSLASQEARPGRLGQVQDPAVAWGGSGGVIS